MKLDIKDVSVDFVGYWQQVGNFVDKKGTSYSDLVHIMHCRKGMKDAILKMGIDKDGQKFYVVQYTGYDADADLPTIQ